MSARLLARSSTVLALVLTGGLALVGGVSLRGAGMVALLLAAVVAACLGAGVARETGRTPPDQTVVEAAWRAAVGTVVVLLVLSGSVVLAGAAAAVLVVVWVALLGLTWWLRRQVHRRPGPRFPVAPVDGPADRPSSRWSRHPSARDGVVPAVPGPPVAPSPAHPGGLSQLSTEALGQEWLRTAAALDSARDLTTRERVVQRRREVLDELERRDPAGFARWLAVGATVDSNPAQHLRGDSSAGSGTA